MRSELPEFLAGECKPPEYERAQQYQNQRREDPYYPAAVEIEQTEIIFSSPARRIVEIRYPEMTKKMSTPTKPPRNQFGNA